jgi:rhodanese-related sulfurtransferase
MSAIGYAGEITPREAWEMLAKDRRAVLVDVRTHAEWAYVGVTDLSSLGKEPLFVPWIEFPTMQANPAFVEMVARACPEQDAPLLFLCRSGVRSKAAAIACTRRGYRACFNIDAGFEGVHDPSRHRGIVNGWKVEGLPWVQG